jgi:nucleotide-binding universal stress UspA family protein
MSRGGFRRGAPSAATTIISTPEELMPMTYTPQHRLRFSQEALRTYPARRIEMETGSLLVGIDAIGDDRGVLSVAGALARRDGRHVHLVGVAPDTWRPAGWPSNSDEGDLRDFLRAKLQDRTRRRLQRILGLSAYWSVDAAFGSLESVLLAEWRRQRPALILLGADQALRLARETDVPVLVIPSDRERLPSRVVVATDLSSGSRHAALTSLRLPGRRAEVTVADVEAASEILALAAQHDADLIVAGTRSRTAHGAAPHDSVARDLLIGASCSVLVVPS